MPLSLDLMPLEEKTPEAPLPKTIVVRFGYLLHIGEFPSDIPHKVGCGSKLVVRTERGTEIAEMLTTTCGNGGCGKSISREKLLSYIDLSGGRDYPFTDSGRILRVATAQDLAEQSKLDEQRDAHLKLAREMTTRNSLPMKIVEVEHILGGERILFYFTSEHRVDFRTLVRDLAHTIHTRIEMRQVGARDDARITADYEKCGQHCCCKQFLKVLTPISMKSAKIQKATLDPAKISGRCGRLMCCLRYEDETYEELRKKLPKRNTRVRTEQGDAWVVDGQILTQLVLVQFDDFKREAIPMEKILEFDRPRPTLPDGRIMQSPNDLPPPPIPTAPPPRGSAPRGPGLPPRAPMPGAPSNSLPPRAPQTPPLNSPTTPTGIPSAAPGANLPPRPFPQNRPPSNPQNTPRQLPQNTPRTPQSPPPRPPLNPPSGTPSSLPHPLARPLPQGPRPPRAAPFRPRPGMPLPPKPAAPQADPLSPTGPTGSDLNPDSPTPPPAPPETLPPTTPPTP